MNYNRTTDRALAILMTSLLLATPVGACVPGKVFSASIGPLDDKIGGFIDVPVGGTKTITASFTCQVDANELKAGTTTSQSPTPRRVNFQNRQQRIFQR